jgi:hypothetical protein
MTLPDIGELETLVRQAAAGEIMPRFRRVSADRKADGSLLTEADLAMDRRLQRQLQARWPPVRPTLPSTTSDPAPWSGPGWPPAAAMSTSTAARSCGTTPPAA